MQTTVGSSFYRLYRYSAKNKQKKKGIKIPATLSLTLHIIQKIGYDHFKRRKQLYEIEEITSDGNSSLTYNRSLFSSFNSSLTGKTPAN